MSYQLSFTHLLTYDTGAPGIGLEVRLRLKDVSITIPANLDTGAGGSIFARRYGEQLGFDIESGLRQPFGTATGSFIAYGHEVTLYIDGIEFNAIVYFAADEHFDRNVIGRFGGLDHLQIGLVDYGASFTSAVTKNNVLPSRSS